MSVLLTSTEHRMMAAGRKEGRIEGRGRKLPPARPTIYVMRIIVMQDLSPFFYRATFLLLD